MREIADIVLSGIVAGAGGQTMRRIPDCTRGLGVFGGFNPLRGGGILSHAMERPFGAVTPLERRDEY